MRIGTSALALIAGMALAACNSASSTNFVASPTPTPANVSGDYSGTMKDALSGSGTATATLAQHASSAGGAITETIGTSSLTAQLSISLSTTNSFSGSMVIDYPTGAQCTYVTSGNYDASGATPVLSGTYTALTNCTGNLGTFLLKQDCSATITTNARRRIVTLPKAC